MPTIRLKAGDELALADGERYALERHHLAVATDDIAQFKHASFPLPNTYIYLRTSDREVSGSLLHKVFP